MKAQKIYTLLLVIFMAGCKEAEFQKYADVDRIQFGPEDVKLLYRADYEKNWKLTDTTKSLSFFFEDEAVTQDTLYYDVYTLGKVSNVDRPFKLVQVQLDNKKNAEPGKHYQGFDAPESENLYVVKAGQAHARIPIVLLRDPSLKDDAFYLQFEIEENEHFSRGQSTNIWRKAIFADKLLQPAKWDASGVQYYWGSYSVAKHQFMIDVTGERWDQAMLAALVFDEIAYYRDTLKKALITYNTQNPDHPKVDENGQLIVFP